MNQDFSVLPVRRLYRYFNILAEGSEKIHEALDGKRSGASSHEC